MYFKTKCFSLYAMSQSKAFCSIALDSERYNAFHFLKITLFIRKTHVINTQCKPLYLMQQFQLNVIWGWEFNKKFWFLKMFHQFKCSFRKEEIHDSKLSYYSTKYPFTFLISISSLLIIKKITMLNFIILIIWLFPKRLWSELQSYSLSFIIKIYSKTFIFHATNWQKN